MALLPETHLTPCVACDELIRLADSICPHCGAARPRHERATSLVALAAALAVVGCAEPDYGVPLTDTLTEPSTSESGTTDATSTDATSTDATSTDATGSSTAATDATETSPTTGETGGTTGPNTTSGTGTTFEPDYGVPATTGE